MAFVDYQKKDNISIITLNRPERLNAISVELGEDLTTACEKSESDPEVRVVILTANGRLFSSGADVKEVGQQRARLIEGPTVALGAMRKITKPAIAAVNGSVVGMACALMMLCDIRIVVKSATFSIAEIKFAIPAGPENMLAENIPLCAAMEFVLTGDPISAQRAYDIGLVNKIVPDEALMPEAIKIAERIAELSPAAIRLVKQARTDAMEASQKMWKSGSKRKITTDEIFATEDFREAVSAFMEKRKPIFKGK